jgi:hypothetical protein
MYSFQRSKQKQRGEWLQFCFFSWGSFALAPPHPIHKKITQTPPPLKNAWNAGTPTKKCLFLQCYQCVAAFQVVGTPPERPERNNNPTNVSKPQKLPYYLISLIIVFLR